MKVWWFYIFFPFCLWVHAVNPRDAIEPKEQVLDFPTDTLFQFQTPSGVPLPIPSTTKVWIGGDVMFQWGVKDAMVLEDPYYPFRNFFPFLQNYDLRVLNLETPILKSPPKVDQKKSYVFYGEKKDLSVLHKLGIQGVFLGNNHTMDFGESGLMDTLSLLQEFGIQSSGAGRNLDEAHKPIAFSKMGIDYHFYSFSDVGETRLFATKNSAGAAYFRVGEAANLIRRSKPNQTNILSVHWGVEYNPFPTDADRRAASYLIQSGYQVIVGHHPHVPQGIEVFPKGVVIYSLGNFFFGSKNLYLKHNITVVLHYEKEKLKVVEVIPVFGEHQKMPGLHHFFPLGPKEAESFLREYAVLCKELGTELIISGGRGYVFLDKELKAKLKP